MLKKTKRKLYVQGLYSCRLPLEDTTQWSVDKWCDWIDKNGSWWKDA